MKSGKEKEKNRMVLQKTKRESCLSLDCADESVIDAKI